MTDLVLAERALRAGSPDGQAHLRNALRAAFAQTGEVVRRGGIAVDEFDDAPPALPPSSKALQRAGLRSVERHVRALLRASEVREAGRPSAFDHLPAAEVGSPFAGRPAVSAPGFAPRAASAAVQAVQAVVIEDNLVAESPPTDLDLRTTPSAELDTLAAELGPSPLRHFAWVFDHVLPEVYRGLKRGPSTTARAQRGNDLDGAALLVELLRRAGIPARLELSQITLLEAQVLPITETESAGAAAALYRSAGLPGAAVVLPGLGAVVQTERWYVRAWVAANNEGSFSEPRWIFLDPMLKDVRLTGVQAPGNLAVPLLDESVLLD
ncbi:MAG: transglutaminase domain-containing protein, partial [Myxococcales bacterium]|nr:transglutaminase domain-containing protein [Myxococcales bacterium]